MSLAPAIYSLPYPGSSAESDDIKGSGFTTGIAWALHVHSNGDLYYNDTLIKTNCSPTPTTTAYASAIIQGLS